MVAQLMLVAVLGAGAAGPTPSAGPAASGAPRRTKVAVGELEAGLGADPKLSHLVTTLLTSELRRRPSLSVTSQEDIKSLLGFERQKAMLGCSQTSCLAEVGGALGVDHMVTGSLSRVGDASVLIVRLVDVHKGAVLRDTTRRFSGGSADSALVDCVPGLAAELYPGSLPEAPAGALSGEAHEHAAPRASSAPWWLAGAGALLGVAGGAVTGIEFATRQSPASAGTQSTGNAVGYAGQVGIGVGVALLAGGVLWGVLRPAPEPAP